MQHTTRIRCCLLGMLCVAAIAVAQGPDEAAGQAAVVPEPAAAPAPAPEPPKPLPEDPAVLPEDPVVLPEDPVVLPEDPVVLPEAPIPPADPAFGPPKAVSGAGNTTTCPQGCRDACGCYSRGWLRRPLCRKKACLQRSHWGYADQFCETPLGACLYSHMNVQIANGTSVRMVLYRYDFHDGILGDPRRLNQHGRKRLREMARLLQCNVHPIIVEQTPEQPALAQARRDHVLSSIEELGLPVPQDWVVVGEPQPRGISGTEAVGIDQKMLDQKAGVGAVPGPTRTMTAENVTLTESVPTTP